MDIERPHRTSSTPTTTSELFICFTSRLSKSSSMRLSSKSILSPSRAADKQNHSLSLSTSLSRRLRHNGSLRGAQSPAMFPSSKKNKGSSGFAENPEPSSPKVTCIGQVRVKTKKQGKKMKMRACRSKRLSGGGGSGGEASFRRIEHSNSHEVLQNQQAQECGLNHRNQRWVHLPVTICEALRTFGSEFSCLFPCKSSCFSSGSFCGGEKTGEKTGENRGGAEHSDEAANSCAVFRWLVSLQEGEGGEGKRRDIELVVGGEEEVERGAVMERECSRRRSIFDDMEFDDLFSNVKNGGDERSEIFGGNVVDDDDEVEEGGRRVSLCIPPKNALLLMRCRSDPMKMASLSRKLWEVEVPLPQDDEDDDDVVEDEVEVEEMTEVVKVVENEAKLEEKAEEIRDAKTEENRDVKTKEIRDAKTEENRDVKSEEMGDDKTDVIGEEITDEIGEEKTVEIGEEMEVLDEGSEEVDQILVKIEDSPDFADEEQRKTEEQSVENRGNAEEEECEVFEETQLIEYEIDAIGRSVEKITVKDKGGDDEIEQDLVKNTEEKQELNIEDEEEKEKIEENVEFSESDDLSIVHEAEEKAGCESSEISTTSSSSLNSSEESTAESKERDEEEEQENKDPVEEHVQEEERKSMEEKPKPSLPDCLLLMMCEPKVSMEVSKETWVCSTDFIRWLPERHPKKVVNKTDGTDEATMKKSKPAAVAAIPSHLVQPVVRRFETAAQPPIQPGRSSISFPAGGGTVANLIEQKLVKAGGYEPFVLTRCKSAPMRSAGKLAPPEMACSLWGRENGRKLEPHRPATFGVGAAGVGF